MWVVRQCPRRGLREWLLNALTIYPFRCQLCTQRFLAFAGRPSFNPSREYERLSVRYPVNFSATRSREQGMGAEGTMVDLSIRGCSIDSSVPVAKGALLRLQFRETSWDQPIEIEGAVVRSVLGKRKGVEFLKIGTDEEGRLRRVIETRLYSRPH